MLNYRLKRLELKLNILNNARENNNQPESVNDAIMSFTSPLASPSFCSNVSGALNPLKTRLIITALKLFYKTQ